MKQIKTIAEKIKPHRNPVFCVYWNNKHKVDVFADQSNGKRIIDYLSVRFNKVPYCIYLDESSYQWESIAEHGCDTIAKDEKLETVLAKTKEHADKISLMYRQITDIGYAKSPPANKEN